MGSTKTKGSAPDGRAKPGSDTPEDRRSRAAHRREDVGEVASSLRAVLREGRFSLEDLLSVFVEDAIERGWVELAADGYAVASLPEKRLSAQVAEDAHERLKRLIADADGFRNSRSDDQEIKALNAALRIPAVQHAALSALGIEFVVPGLYEAQEAGDLAPDCAMVHHGVFAGVPAVMLDRVAPAISRLHVHKIKTWEAALVTAVWSAMCRDGDARSRVEWVLAGLKHGASEGIPRAFLTPLEEHLTKATRLMRTLQLARLKPEFRPPRAPGGLGRPLSDQGAAAAFARCFGVTMERKESRRKRRKT